MKKVLIIFFVFLVACEDEFITPLLPTDYVYSGTIYIIKSPKIVIDGMDYPNDLNTGFLLATVSEQKETDQIQFTLFTRKLGIYEADFWVNHPDCLEFNNLEQVIISQDTRGNDVIKVYYPDSYWKDCYYSGEKEKGLTFLIKCRNPMF